MHAHHVMVVSLSAISLAGCAGPSAFQEIRRLRADVGLLDQRITQLERMSVKESTSNSWPTGSQPQPFLTTVPTPAQPPTAPVTKPPAALMAKHSKRDIQQALKNAGFYQGSVDGKIGPQTHEAIKQFQQANGLKVDGIVGRHTWAKLAPYLSLGEGGTQPSASQLSK